MIKEILEYGDGPSPIPRLPLNQYPMGMVPGIHDQVSDHLKRNWLWYLLGGGMLFGPGMSKKNAFNKAVTARDNFLSQYAQHQDAYGKNKKAYLDAQYSNFGSPEEKEAAFQRDQQDRLNKANDYHSKASEHAQAYNNSFAAKLPFFGGEVSTDQSPTNPGLFGSANLDTYSGVDAVQQEQEKSRQKAIKNVQDLMDDETEKFINGKQDFDPSKHLEELKRHLKSQLGKHSAFDDDNLTDVDGNKLNVDHFIKDKFDRMADERADMMARKQQFKDQQDAENQQNNVNLIDSDPKSLNDNQKMDRFNQLIQNDPNLSDNYQKLKDWKTTFKTEIPDDHPLIGLAKSAGANVPFLKEYISGNDKNPLTTNDQRLNAIYRSLQYVNANNDQFSQNPSADDAMQDLISKVSNDSKHAALESMSAADREAYLRNNENHILDDMENHHNYTMMDHTAKLLGAKEGITGQHISSLWQNKNFDEIDPTTLRHNPNLVQQAAGNGTTGQIGSTSGGPTPNPNPNTGTTNQTNTTSGGPTPNPNPNTTQTNVSASNTNINDIIKSYLFNEDSDEFGHRSGRVLDDDEDGFLKKHYGKILAGLGAATLGITRNHLKANAHEANAEYFYAKGNRSLGDDELAKANVKRSIDPIYRAKNMYHSMRERFGK